MNFRLRAGVLAVLGAAAVYASLGAVKSLRPTARDVLPTEIYARYAMREENAQFFLKNCDGFVAVYKGAKGRTPESVTAIEIASLRSADRAMLNKGIPVSTRQELLELLEDLS